MTSSPPVSSSTATVGDVASALPRATFCSTEHTAILRLNIYAHMLHPVCWCCTRFDWCCTRFAGVAPGLLYSVAPVLSVVTAADYKKKLANIAKDERGYGLTVSSESPVLVQSVKEGVPIV